MAEPLNATFFALRKRERGGVLLGAAIAYTVALFVAFLVFGTIAFFLIGGGDFLSWYAETISAASSGVASDRPPPDFGGIMLMIPVQFLLIAALFILFAAFHSSAVRWMLRGETSAPFNLCFGADMWRAYGTYWAWLLYVIVGWLGFFLTTLVGGVLAGNIDVVGPLMMFALCVFYFFAWFYVTIRLSPAVATSIGLGEFAPLKAWAVTRGRFWALFGAYLLLAILYMLVSLIVTAVLFGAVYGQAFAGLDWSTMATDPEGFAVAYERAALGAMQSMFASPLMIALYIGGQLVSLAISAFFNVMWFGVESRAVQAALEEGKIEPAPADA
ncbi:MAG: hypothetical protein AB7O98_05505 [Hyphomonadaceae bacterium]